MIGGSGPKKTLRTLARYGDQWNANGTLEKLTESDAILREHCAAVGRDQARSSARPRCSWSSATPGDAAARLRALAGARRTAVGRART